MEKNTFVNITYKKQCEYCDFIYDLGAKNMDALEKKIEQGKKDHNLKWHPFLLA